MGLGFYVNSKKTHGLGRVAGVGDLDEGLDLSDLVFASLQLELALRVGVHLGQKVVGVNWKEYFSLSLSLSLHLSRFLSFYLSLSLSLSLCISLPLYLSPSLLTSITVPELNEGIGQSLLVADCDSLNSDVLHLGRDGESADSESEKSQPPHNFFLEYTVDLVRCLYDN